MERRINGLVGLATLMMLLGIPIAFADTTGNLGATLTIGNSAPTVPLVFCDSVTPSAGTFKNITCYFNVTDGNGINDISMSGQQVNITNGTSTINSTICVSMKNYTAQRTSQFNCTIRFIYYIQPYGMWNVTVNATDGADYGFNTTTSTALTNISVNSLTALEIASPLTNITFGEIAAGSNDNAADNDPVILNNTGNVHLGQINISGNNLTGHTTATEHIYAGNFSANDADAANGEALKEEVLGATTIASIVVPVGVPAASKDNVYVYVDVNAGLSNQAFSATKSGRDWVWGIVS